MKTVSEKVYDTSEKIVTVTQFASKSETIVIVAKYNESKTALCSLMLEDYTIIE